MTGKNHQSEAVYSINYEQFLRELVSLFPRFSDNFNVDLKMLCSRLKELLSAACVMYIRIQEGIYFSTCCWDRSSSFKNNLYYYLTSKESWNNEQSVCVISNLQEKTAFKEDKNITEKDLNTCAVCKVQCFGRNKGLLCAFFKKNTLLTSKGKIILSTAASLIGREEKHEKDKQSLKDIIENIADMVSFTDENGTFKYVSPSHKKILGYDPKDLTGQSFFELVHAEDLDKVIKEFEEAVKTASIKKQEFRYLHADGNFLWIENSAKPLYDRNSNFKGAIFCGRDITDRKNMEEQLRYLTLFDQLTGLYNRTYFAQEMRRMEDERYSPVGLLICDIDGLKMTNDTRGHDSGDILIKSAANIIRQSFRKSDAVARIGGDEFAVILPQCSEEILKEAVQRIKNAVIKHNSQNPQSPLNISVGYAVNNENPVDMNELFNEADNNMYSEKNNNKSCSYSLQPLLKLLESRDFIAQGHVDRMQRFITELAFYIGITSEEKIEKLKMLAQFHDIGEIAIPDRILFKETPLSPEEKREIKRHCEIGREIANSTQELGPIADWILKHHEWWNGKGYPLGLSGSEIPIECRILAIIDAFDAMISDRPYRKTLPREKALAELRRCAGTQFSPVLVEKFALYFENNYNHI